MSVKDDAALTGREGGYIHVLRIAYPIIIATSSATVMQFADRMMLGRYSGAAMAAALGAGITAFACMTFFIGTAGYVSTFVAQYHGAERPERVGVAVWQGVFFSLAAGLLLAGLAHFSEGIMGLARHDPAVMREEVTYFRILMLGAVFPVMGSALSGFYNGLGRPVLVTAVQIIGNIVNIALNYVLIFGHMGFPRWGIKGAAVATVAAGGVSLAILAVMMALGPLGKRYRVWASLRLDVDLLRRLLRFGMPSGVQWTLDMIGFTAFVWFVGRLGQTQLEAVSATFAINHLAFMPMIGFGVATSVLVGRFVAAGKPEIARRATRHAFVMTFVYMCLVAAVFVVFPEQLVGLFGDRDTADFAAVVALSTVLLRFVAVYSIFDGGNIVYSSALRGAGDTVFVMFMIMGLSIGGLVIPTWLVVEVFDMGLYAAMVPPTAYVIVLAAAFYLRYRTGKWESMRVIEGAGAGAAPVTDAGAAPGEEGF